MGNPLVKDEDLVCIFKFYMFFSTSTNFKNTYIYIQKIIKIEHNSSFKTDSLSKYGDTNAIKKQMFVLQISSVYYFLIIELKGSK